MWSRTCRSTPSHEAPGARRVSLERMDELLREIESAHGVRFADGLQLMSATALLRRPFDPAMPVLLLGDVAGDAAPGAGATDPRAVVPGRQAHASDPSAM